MNLVGSLKPLDQTWLLSGFLVNVNISKNVGVDSIKFTQILIKSHSNWWSFLIKYNDRLDINLV